MPSEGIRSIARYQATASSSEHHISVQGRTVRIHLVGILDRQNASDLIQEANRYLMSGRFLVVLDACRLDHLDFRCVSMLLRWSRGLASFGHRLLLEHWNPYLRAILAMEDWDGELAWGSRGPGWRSVNAQLAHVQAP